MATAWAFGRRSRRGPVAHRQAQQVEGQRGQPDHRRVGDEGLPVLGQRQQDDHQQQQRGKDLHRLLQAIRHGRQAVAHQHADGHRAEDDDEDLHDLAELQGIACPSPMKYCSDRLTISGMVRMAITEFTAVRGDVQCHVAMRQVAVEVGGGAAGRGRQQHHADRQGRLQGEAWTIRNRPGAAGRSGTPGRPAPASGSAPRGGSRPGSGQSETEHDDAQGDGEEQGQDGIGGHYCYCSDAMETGSGPGFSTQVSPRQWPGAPNRAPTCNRMRMPRAGASRLYRRPLRSPSPRRPPARRYRW